MVFQLVAWKVDSWGSMKVYQKEMQKVVKRDDQLE